MPIGLRWGLTPAQQADATLSQNNPTSGTQYPVLAATANVRVITAGAKCTWTVQPTPLEIHITIDGQTIDYIVADPVSDTWYSAVIVFSAAGTAQALTTVGQEQYRSFLCEGRSVAVAAEITGGTVSNLASRVKYAQW